MNICPERGQCITAVENSSSLWDGHGVPPQAQLGLLKDGFSTDLSMRAKKEVL